jgi:uncharacterized protein (DUF362 family)
LEPVGQPSGAAVRVHTGATARLDAVIRAELARALGHLRPRHIVIKPNWVLHEPSPRSPIAAMVTDARVIGAVARAAADLFPGAERITVGDCPLQRADWPLMAKQSGLADVIDAIAQHGDQRTSFRDLRRDVYGERDGRLVMLPAGEHGDPLGYREVRLGGDSHLDAISDRADRFAIHDHDRAKTRDNHRKGDHRYLIAQTFLDADLVINLPKWKTHSKAAVTGALKNLVGINGDKAYLPHFSRGAPKWGGDEYWDQGRWIYWTQNTMRELLRTRAWWAYKSARPFWLAFKAARRTWQPAAEGPPPDFYVGGGSWHGNQTIWRMIYDLNRLLQCADRDGVLQPTPQREYFCIVDGLICGEGDGPLFASPRPVDWLVCGADPFAIDAVLGWCMGFEPARVPILAHRHEYRGPSWGRFDVNALPVAIDDATSMLTAIQTRFDFAPPPGWSGYVERAKAELATAV